jgi:hypothetical protein
MSRHLRLSDGTTWPRPDLESDADAGLAWRLTYGEPTRADLLQAASVIRAYGYLLTETTRTRRDQVCRDVRATLREETA